MSVLSMPCSVSTSALVTPLCDTVRDRHWDRDSRSERNGLSIQDEIKHKRDQHTFKKQFSPV